MLTTMVIVWGSGLALFLALSAMLALARLGSQHFRVRRLTRRLAHNQVRLSRDRPQIKRQSLRER